MKKLFRIGLLVLLPTVLFAVDNDMAFIGAALAVGLSSIAAGIAVGLIGSSALGAISEKPEISGKALIFLGLAEGIAIYGLIISIMILGKID